MSDALSRLLQEVRPRGAVFDRSFLESPWSMHFDDRAQLSLAVMLRGEAWLAVDGEPPLRLLPGAVAVVSGPSAYTISDSPGITPQVFIQAEGCSTRDGRPVEEMPGLCGVHDVEGASVLLRAAFNVHAGVGDRVLRGMPVVVLVENGSENELTLGSLQRELGLGRPGQQAIVERLLELLLVTSLRDVLDQPESGAPAWYHAYTDAVVGAALRLLHEQPAEPWTLASLARRLAVSRSTLARRFTELVSEPPMSYLACWRMCLAADLLRDTDDTVASIARRVGYANTSALSVAFTRVHGVRPTEHRQAARAAA